MQFWSECKWYSIATWETILPINLKINLVLAIMIGSLVIQLPMSNENHKQTKMLTTFHVTEHKILQ